MEYITCKNLGRFKTVSKKKCPEMGKENCPKYLHYKIKLWGSFKALGFLYGAHSSQGIAQR